MNAWCNRAGEWKEWPQALSRLQTDMRMLRSISSITLAYTTLLYMVNDRQAKTLEIATKHQPKHIKLSQLHAVIVFQQAFQWLEIPVLISQERKQPFGMCKPLFWTCHWRRRSATDWYIVYIKDCLISLLGTCRYVPSRTIIVTQQHQMRESSAPSICRCVDGVSASVLTRSPTCLSFRM